MYGALDDMTLVARLQGGDASALETLMERHAARAYRLACVITRNHADAEEVVQDVFLSVFRKIATFERRAAFRTWIYRITANLALTKRRASRPTSDEYRVGERADRSPTPEEHLLAREARTSLARLVDGLPASYRTVVVLSDVKGLTVSEVADTLGTSVPSVKCRLHRGRAWLRRQVGTDARRVDPLATGERVGPRRVSTDEDLRLGKVQRRSESAARR